MIVLLFWQVVFLALDGRTKNIACTYSLEHRSIDGLFDSIFSRLDVLLEESDDIAKEFQELVFCIGTLEAFICQHMLKEEEQVATHLNTYMFHAFTSCINICYTLGCWFAILKRVYLTKCKTLFVITCFEFLVSYSFL